MIITLIFLIYNVDSKHLKYHNERILTIKLQKNNHDINL